MRCRDVEPALPGAASWLKRSAAASTVGLVQVPVFRKWEVATQWLPVAQVVNFKVVTSCIAMCLPVPVVMVSPGREQASRRGVGYDSERGVPARRERVVWTGHHACSVGAVQDHYHNDSDYLKPEWLALAPAALSYTNDRND